MDEDRTLIRIIDLVTYARNPGLVQKLFHDIATISNTPMYTHDHPEKDRYSNVRPSLLSRVTLKQLSCCLKDTTYINASHVNINPKCHYISCQAPVPTSIPDFWRMCWEHDVSLVLMLTDFVEHNRLKAHRYWDDSSSLHLQSVTVDILLHVSLSKELSIRTVKLTNKSGEYKEVVHIHYTGWPDFGVPTDFTSYTNMFTEYRSRLSDPTPTAVIHCSAGLGRTGTFIVIDTILELVSSYDDKLRIDPVELVLALRAHRPGSIQTPEQLHFVYQYIEHCMENKLFIQ